MLNLINLNTICTAPRRHQLQNDRRASAISTLNLMYRNAAK